MKKKIILIAGTRPDFIKIAPLLSEFKKYPEKFETFFIHTGQHYDFTMSKIFFENLNIPKPDTFLNIGSASHAKQTAKIMVEFEKILLKEKPDFILVTGDVNSTLACALTAKKLNIKLIHVEAGLRSFDNTMPEEINRIITDSISDYLFVTEKDAIINLKNEGISEKKIFFVGNVMIDTLLSNMEKIDTSTILNSLSLTSNNYSVLTLHRPSNVDSKKSLEEIYSIISNICKKIKIIYPLHPRTKKSLEKHKLFEKFVTIENFTMINSLGYIDFINLIKNSKFILTDSGGIQEEATILKIPCLTMRENTERPVTITQGTNYLVDKNKKLIFELVNNILKEETSIKDISQPSIPSFWDGKTAQRIVENLDPLHYFLKIDLREIVSI
jgi:UDP-N-acetylglucosamine 2-epimerase (non-hydrolysing)